MKNKLFKVITAALSVFTLASCGSNTSKTDVKQIAGLGYSEKDFVGVKGLSKCLFVGETKQIELESMPQNYSGKVTFESSNTSVATVSATGEVKAVSEGLAIVLVKDDAGDLVTKVNVIVAKKDNDNAVRVINNIKDAYNTGYSAPKKAHKFEYSYEKYVRDGVVDHGYISQEETFYDKSRGLFMISGDDIQIYTRGGAKEVANGSWYFQVLGMKTRMVHVTENVKNYFDFNSADYGMDKYRAIEDVLDLFFVSGKKIVNDLLEDYSGKDDFLYYSSFFPGDSGISCYGDNGNNLSMQLSFKNQKGVVDIEDELLYVDMYTGQEYVEDDDISYVYEGNVCRGLEISATYNYDYDGSKWQRNFLRSMLFDDDYEPLVFDFTDKEMKDAGYFKVDALYDL